MGPSPRKIKKASDKPVVDPLGDPSPDRECVGRESNSVGLTDAAA